MRVVAGRRLDPFPPGLGGIIPPESPPYDQNPVMTSNSRRRSTKIPAQGASTTAGSDNLYSLLGIAPITSSGALAILSFSVTPSTSTVTSAALTMSTSVNAQPQTNVQTHVQSVVYSPPTSSSRPLSSSQSSASSVPLNIPLISIALVSGGAALLALIVLFRLRRLCCASTSRKQGAANLYDDIKDSPLFGGSGDNAATIVREKYTDMGLMENWSNMQESLTRGMGRMSTAVDRQAHKHRASYMQHDVPLNGGTDGWTSGLIEQSGIAGLGLSGVVMGGAINPSYNYEHAYGHSPADTLVSRSPPEAYYLLHDVSTDTGATVSGSIGSFYPEDTYDPRLAVGVLADTKPLNIRRSDRTDDRKVSCPVLQATASSAVSSLAPLSGEPKPTQPPSGPLHSILKHKGARVNKSATGMAPNPNMQYPYISTLLPTHQPQNRNVPVYDTANLSERRDPSGRFVGPHDLHAPRTQQRAHAHFADVISSSGSAPSVKRNSHHDHSGSSATESSGREFPHGLEFPLPPKVHLTGTISSSGTSNALSSAGMKSTTSHSRLPYTSSVRTIGGDAEESVTSSTATPIRRTSTGRRSSTHLGPNSFGSGGPPPSASPSFGFTSVGDLMMRGFAGGDSEISGDETVTDFSEIEEGEFEIATLTKHEIFGSLVDGASGDGITNGISMSAASKKKRMSTASMSAKNRDSSYEDSNLGVGNAKRTSFFRIPPPPPPPPHQHQTVPSILITATPSADSLKTLNRRLSRALELTGNRTGRLPSSGSLPSYAHSRSDSNTRPLLPTSRSRFESDDDDDDDDPDFNPFEDRQLLRRRGDSDGIALGAGSSPSRPDSPSSPQAPQISLSQMALERSQPDYRSATYSIYNMYHDTGGGRDSGIPSLPAHASFLGSSKAITLSTIPSGQGITDVGVGARTGIQGRGIVADEDIGASFAKELDASLGNIRF